MIKNRLKEIRLRVFFIDRQQKFAELLEINKFQYNRYEKEEVAPSLESAIVLKSKINKALSDKGIEKVYTVDDLFYLEE